MFTGIIEEVGTIKSLSVIGKNQSELCISCTTIQADLKTGDSVAVDGVCLTVIHFDDQQVRFELSNETLETTIFPGKRDRTKVNLERALKLCDRLGGHIVQGHVDCRSKLLKINKIGNFYEMDFALDLNMMKYIAYKGSIAVNGISLTVAELTREMFRVAVIPHTYQQTSLSELRITDNVHIETDVIARYIERLLPFQTNRDFKETNITIDFLNKHGF